MLTPDRKMPTNHVSFYGSQKIRHVNTFLANFTLKGLKTRSNTRKIKITVGVLHFFDLKDKIPLVCAFLLLADTT